MTTTDYDHRRNSREGYDLAIAAIREINIRAGTLPPRTDDERRQAAQGPVPVPNLDAVK